MPCQSSRLTVVLLYMLKSMFNLKSKRSMWPFNCFCGIPNSIYRYYYALVWWRLQITPLLSHYSSDKAFSMSDCGEYGAPNSSVCSSLIWEFQSNTPLALEAYIGSACTSYLLSWQNCAVGPTD